MQHGIDVMKEVRRRDAVVRVENPEQRPRFGRDVFLLVLAVCGTGEEWEILKAVCACTQMQIGRK